VAGCQWLLILALIHRPFHLIFGSTRTQFLPSIDGYAKGGPRSPAAPLFAAPRHFGLWLFRRKTTSRFAEKQHRAGSRPASVSR